MTFLKELVKSTAWLLTALIGCLIIGGALFWWFNDESKMISDGSCTIAVIPIRGEIVPYPHTETDALGTTYSLETDPDTFAAQVRAAERDSHIKGILVRIDSGGGAPAASEAMMQTLQHTRLPVAAFIRELGASGAYLVASGADTIVASKYADVGSIGVTMSYLDHSEQNKQNGLKYVSLSSAKYKDYGSTDKPLTGEERALYERDLKILHQAFVNDVAKNRNLPLEKVEALADGSSLPGTLAKEAGLIDRIGDQESIRQWFSDTLHIKADDITYCE